MELLAVWWLAGEAGAGPGPWLWGLPGRWPVWEWPSVPDLLQLAACGWPGHLQDQQSEEEGCGAAAGGQTDSWGGLLGRRRGTCSPWASSSSREEQGWELHQCQVTRWHYEASRETVRSRQKSTCTKTNSWYPFRPPRISRLWWISTNHNYWKFNTNKQLPWLLQK